MFTFVLKCDNNETYEDVDHEEGNDDNVDNIVNCDDGPKIVNRPVVFCVRINGSVEQSAKNITRESKIVLEKFVLPRPALKGRHREQGEHGFWNVVKVKNVSWPRPVAHLGLVYVSTLKFQISATENKNIKLELELFIK